MILVALRQCPIWSDYPELNSYRLITCEDTSLTYLNHNFLNDQKAVQCLIELGLENIKFKDVPKEFQLLESYQNLSNIALSVNVSK
jgi:hypothetical protein